MRTRVAILGGGPAGAALAVELRDLGVDALVVAQPRPRRCFEGMSERTAALLDRLDFVHARSVLRPPGPRHALWNGAVNRHNSEHLVERGALDRALLADLRRQDLPVAETACRACEFGDGRWRIATDMGGITADFVVEARGRAAPVGAGTLFRGPATVALARLFHNEPAADSTALVPFDQGWAWMSRGADGIAAVQFTIAAESVAEIGKAGLTDLHERLSARVEAIAGWLAADAAPLGEATTRDCTAYLRDAVAGPTHLRVGDAACGLDPLSGQGVFLALAGAMAAAAVINTCLNRPADGAAAQDFHRQRVGRQFFDKVALGRDFYGLEQRWSDQEFWRTRREITLPAAEPALVAGAQIRPVLDHGWICRREVLVTPDHPLGVWRLDDVPVVELARAMGTDGFSPEAYAGARGHPPQAVWRALTWLRQIGARTA